MTRSFLTAYLFKAVFKRCVILTLSAICITAAVRPAAAFTSALTMGLPSFSPGTIISGQTFTFAVNLQSTIVLSNAVVVMQIRNSANDVVLEKDVPGQNFLAGQTNYYSWNGTIPSGQTSSVPFASGHYKMVVAVTYANSSALYMPVTNAAYFTVGWGATTAPTVGNAAIPPIPSPAGTGNTYYVSDPSNPAVDLANRALLTAGATVFKTIQAAANVTQPGDTVLVMNGTYEPNPKTWVNSVVAINTSGSAAGGYITFEAYPGHHPIITSSNTQYTYDVLDIYGSYIVIRGFEVIGSAQNVTLAYATQTANTELALLQQEAAARQPATYPSSIAKDVTNGNCIYGTNVTHVIIVNNLVHDCSAAGIGINRSDYTTIEANTVYNSSWWTLYDTSGISIGSTINSDSSTAYKNFVLDNISYNNANTQPNVYDVYTNDVTPGAAPPYPTDGEGIIVDTNQSTNNGSPYVGRTLVARNIVYGNGGGGIEIYRSSHVDAINNTAYMNDTCPVSGSLCGPLSTAIIGTQSPVSGTVYGQIYSNYGNDNNMYNNILYAPPGKYVYTNWGNSNIAENNNIMYSPSGQILMDNYKPAANDLTVSPIFSNPAPATNNFALSAASPGVNSGLSYTNDNISVAALLGLNVVNGAVAIGADP